MEAIYHDSVSEFDLNLFGLSTTDYQANTIPHHVSNNDPKQQMVFSIRQRLRGTSAMVKRAKEVNDCLKIVESELKATKAELEDTKRTLFEKNEELKESCIQRNTYYNKAIKYESDLQIAKEKVKIYEEKDYDYETQNRVTTHHIEQIKALENIITQKDKAIKDRSATCANRKTELLEKKLVRVLTDYVHPTIKKRDKWLDNLMKKYLPANKYAINSSKDILNETDDEPFDELDPMSPLSPEMKDEQKTLKLDNQSKTDEVILDNGESPTNTATLNRNISLDFDFVGSVDTGRGSSLAFSDGEKSAHSPDYYLNDSPVSNVCNKCNLKKADVSTSPIPETSNIVDSVPIDASKACIVLIKKDACTSPLPFHKFNVTTHTSEILYEKCHKLKADASTSPQKIYNSQSTTAKMCHLNDTDNKTKDREAVKTNLQPAGDEKSEMINANIMRKRSLTSPLDLLEDTSSDAHEFRDIISRTPTPVHDMIILTDGQNCTNTFSHELLDSPKRLFNDTQNTIGMSSTACSPASSVENFTSSVENNQNMDVPQIYVTSNNPQEPSNLLLNLTLNNENIASDVYRIPSLDGDLTIMSDNDFDEAPSSCNISKKEVLLEPLDSKILNSMELNNNVSKGNNPVKGLLENNSTIPSDSYDELDNHYVSFSNKKIPCTPTTSDTELDISRSIVQEKEFLELHNSKNMHDDISNNLEVQSILSTMKLREKIITPIPTTPPRRLMPSPRKTIAPRNNDVKYLRYEKEMDELVKNFRIGVDRLVREIVYRSDSDATSDENLNIQNSTDRTHNSPKGAQEVVNIMEIHNEISNTTQAVRRYVDMLKYDKDLEELDQESISAMNYKCNENVPEKQSLSTELRSVTQNSKSGIVLKDIKAKNAKNSRIEATLKDPFLNDKRNINSIDSLESTKHPQVATIKQNTSTLLNAMHLINDDNESSFSDNIAETSQYISESDEFEQVRSKTRDNITYTDHENEAAIRLPMNLRKSRKLTKLEKLRTKMMPKSKIRKEILLRRTKKPRFKPSPITVVHKKKIKASDTSATLNDKSVYDNAVKVVAAAKAKKILTKKPIVMFGTNEKEVKNDSKLGSSTEKSIRTNTTSNNINKTKKKLSLEFENVTREHPKRISVDSIVPMKPKRARISRSSESSGKTLLSLCSNNSVSHSEIKTISNYSDLTSKGTKFNQQALLLDSNQIENEVMDTTPTNASILNPEKTDEKSSNHSNGDSVVVKPKRGGICGRETADNKLDNVVTDQVEKIPKKRRITKRRDSDDTPLIMLVEVSPDKIKTPITNNSHLEDDLKCDKRNLMKTTFVDSPTNNNDNIYNNNEIVNNCTIIDRSQTKHDDLCDASIALRLTPQRVLRSSVKQSIDKHIKPQPCSSSQKNPEGHKTGLPSSGNPKSKSPKHDDRIVSYGNICVFTNEELCGGYNSKTSKDSINLYKNNMLCNMIEKYGVSNYKKRTARKVPESQVNELSNKIETTVSGIIQLPHSECEGAMKRLVSLICSWDVKHFLVGFMAYLKDNTRKLELFSKVVSPPAPPMTKQEQVLLYVIDELQNCIGYEDIVQKILLNIEYALFALNDSPQLDVVESMSHFYALLCRHYQKMSKLRLFIVDAMYCFQFKSLVLIKQCLEVWAFVLPLAHMGVAKSPLVTCLVYLLYFYKFEDKTKRIEDMRFILRRKYSYELSDWNENKILDAFRTAILEIRDNPLEKKMLRLALLILAKRYKATWCQNNIVKKMLQPMIADESTPDVAKRFCVSVLGPLLKPYPNNMKVHSEMVTDYLFGLLEQNQSRKMQEAIVSSLICFCKQNQRVDKFLLKWNPQQISPEFKAVFIEYVRSRPINQWKYILSKID